MIWFSELKETNRKKTDAASTLSLSVVKKSPANRKARQAKLEISPRADSRTTIDCRTEMPSLASTVRSPAGFLHSFTRFVDFVLA